MIVAVPIASYTLDCMGVGTGVATGARAPPVFELPVSSESEIHLKVGVVSPKILPTRL